MMGWPNARGAGLCGGEDGLGERARERLAHRARDDVGGAARREADDQVQRPARVLRKGAGRDGGENRDENRDENCGDCAMHQRPPVTSMKMPVLYDDSVDISQRIASATSSGRPPRFIGTESLTRSTRPGSPPEAWMSV